MQTIGYVSFIVDGSPCLFLQNQQSSALSSCLVVLSTVLPYLMLFFKHSFFFRKAMLYEIGGYYIPSHGGIGANAASSASLLFVPIL
jgi:hypothetical protein